MVGDIRNLFGQKKEDYYRPVRVGNCWSRNYIEYESNNDKTKTLSIREYLNKIRPSLKDIINNLKKSDTWKTSSKDNEEERANASNKYIKN